MVKSIITEMLGKSPVEPIKNHINTAVECAKKVPDLIEAANLNDWNKVEDINNEIRDLENKADTIKMKIRSNLPKSLFMPVPREDLLELVVVQDKVANTAKSISGMVRQRRIQIPKSLFEGYMALLNQCVEAAEFAKTSVNELDELYETGFRGAEVDLVHDLINRLDEIETKTDEKEDQLQYELFKIEKELPPVDVMFLYKLIDKTGRIADMSERVGRRLELLLAK